MKTHVHVMLAFDLLILHTLHSNCVFGLAFTTIDACLQCLYAVNL